MSESTDLTGVVLGDLTIVEYAGLTTGDKRHYKQWLCRCVCGNEKLVHERILRRHINSGKMVSCECMDDKKQPVKKTSNKKSTKKPSKKNNKTDSNPSDNTEDKSAYDLNDLYQYMKDNVLNLPDDAKLNRFMKTKLKNLSEDYGVDTVMNTFKDCNSSIQKAFRNKSFNDEKHCFNYAFKSVQNNIKRIHSRMDGTGNAIEQERTDETNEARAEEIVIKGLDLSNFDDYVNNYKKRNFKPNPLFDSLWCNNGVID